MTPEDPVLIFQSDNSMYALLVQNYLTGQGIEVFDRDLGTAKYLDGQVWIRFRDSKIAVELLKKYSEWISTRSETLQLPREDSIEVVCEECGEITNFPGTLVGSVQECSICLTYLDVGDDESVGDDWDYSSEEE